MKKVLFFFPHNPFPPKTGAHKRCLELLVGLRELGCDITFASSTYTSDQIWSPAGIEGLQKKIGCKVELHTPSDVERIVSKAFNVAKRIFLNDQYRLQTRTSVSICSWFSDLSRSLDPEILFMNYVFYDSIADQNTTGRVCKKIMEMHDLVTLNLKMQKAILKLTGFNRLKAGQIPQEVLDVNFFQARDFSADRKEFEVYDKYDFTLCISENEKNIVSTYAPNTEAVFLPMTHSVSYLHNTYSADAFFCLGPNIFNIQGYYFFIDKVLPIILKKQPDFRLVVTGNTFCNISPVVPNGVIFKGFVDNLQYFYENSKFFICPVFGGTGQQVKIVESMAHGLPVIALHTMDSNSPIRHNINGLLARNAEDFAECVIKLWNNKEICSQLGDNSRETIATEFSDTLLCQNLKYVLDAQ